MSADDVTERAGGLDEAAPRAGVLGHFELGRRLGIGGMGVVFAARDQLLDREVALKLMLPDPTDDGRAGLLREAQALARLSHPNVVTVHEVGIAGDELFIAMELVDGTTLRDWIATARPWRDVVDVFVAAGRGLAAAHALGLVHRDVKPGNVLLDRAGVPKVSDFGLAATATAAPSRIGLGTPGYMAPEQAAGGAVDARADQYSFAVSLREGLTGVGPRAGGAGRPVPPRLRSILARATDGDPARRYPTMAALLAELARARRRGRWIAPAAAALAIAAAAGIAVVAVRPAPAAAVCPAPRARLAAAWGLPARIAIAARAGAIDPAEGAARDAVAAGLFDRYADGWSAMHVEACRANRVDGAQSDALLDQRMGCLDRRLAELRGTIARFARATSPAELDAALARATRLTPLDGCADAAALAQVVALPDDAAARAAVARVLTDVDAIVEAVIAGRLDTLEARAQATVTAARATGHAPTLASALDALERVQRATGAIDGELVTARELVEVSAAAHHDVAAAQSLMSLALLLGRERHEPDQGLALLTAARAAVARVGAPPWLQSTLLGTEGAILTFTPRQDDAIARLTDAVALARTALAGGTPSTHARDASNLIDRQVDLGVAQAQAGQLDGAIAVLRAAIADDHALYGGDHGDEAIAWANLGFAYGSAGQADDAIAALEQATRIAAARLAGSPLATSLRVDLGGAYNSAGRFADALATLDRAAPLLDDDDPARSQLLGSRAIALKHLDRLDDAARAYDQAIALLARPGGDPRELATTHYNRGELARERGRCADALADYARADALWIEVGGPDTFWQIYTRYGTGRCLVELGRPAEAIAPLTRAATLPTPGPGALEQAAAGYFLGRALVETGRDRAGGLAKVRAARVALAGFGDDAAPELAELDAWLAGR